MQIIPAINESTFAAVEEKLAKCGSFLPHNEWIQFDISDGRFTETPTWNNPADLAGLDLPWNIEVHLMVENPESVLNEWLHAMARATKGKRRAIVHFEAMSDPASIIEACRATGAEAGIALKPLTPPDLALLYLRDFSMIQVLAVEPGPSGQGFMQSAIPKIQLIRQRAPHAIIEVDGGMNPETAMLVKNAGADAIVSGSYIFSHPSPKVAYEELTRV